ncbi:unnamed protein product [Pedinophyceae sp. YPF-701]|nr:unnamed protein product [Pedinophyceae sp. YPF-701]
MDEERATQATSSGGWTVPFLGTAAALSATSWVLYCRHRGRPPLAPLAPLLLRARCFCELGLARALQVWEALAADHAALAADACDQLRETLGRAMRGAGELRPLVSRYEGRAKCLAACAVLAGRNVAGAAVAAARDAWRGAGDALAAHRVRVGECGGGATECATECGKGACAEWEHVDPRGERGGMDGGNNNREIRISGASEGSEGAAEGGRCTQEFAAAEDSDVSPRAPAAVAAAAAAEGSSDADGTADDASARRPAARVSEDSAVRPWSEQLDPDAGAESHLEAVTRVWGTAATGASSWLGIAGGDGEWEVVERPSESELAGKK